MLVRRHRIGKYLPAVVHPGPDPAALAVCREFVAEPGVECIILHGSRAWGGWDEQSDLDLIVIHEEDEDEGSRQSLLNRLEGVTDRNYPDCRHHWAVKYEQEVVTPQHYAARRRTLNHHMARAARRGVVFPASPGTEARYRHDGDTSNEWELVTVELLEQASEWNQVAAHCRSLVHLKATEGLRSRPSYPYTMEGRSSHNVLWHSGAALLSILGALYPTDSVEEMARRVREHDAGWRHEFRSNLDRIDQYAGCGCELVVADPVGNGPELWESLDEDRDALWQRILELSGYDLNEEPTTGEEP